MPETWKPIPGWEGYYEVSDHGNVRSVNRIVSTSSGRKVHYTGVHRKPRAEKTGHLALSLTKNSQKAYRYVHRLVLEAFVGPCPEGMQACHKDGNPANNHLSNLRWDTQSANTFDQVVHGVHHEARKTHCKRGHLLEMPNLSLPQWDRGKRACLACRRAHGYLRKHPELWGSYKEISDSYYSKIMYGNSAVA